MNPGESTKDTVADNPAVSSVATCCSIRLGLGPAD